MATVYLVLAYRISDIQNVKTYAPYKYILFHQKKNTTSTYLFVCVLPVGCTFRRTEPAHLALFRDKVRGRSVPSRVSQYQKVAEIECPKSYNFFLLDTS